MNLQFNRWYENQKITIEYDAAVKEKDNQIKLLEKFLE